MKKIIVIILSAAMISVCSLVHAQEQDTTSTDLRLRTEEQPQQEQQTEEELEQARDDMQEYLEHSSERARLIENKVGPDGQPVYMDDDGRFYYINENGKKKRIKESKLKDKPE